MTDEAVAAVAAPEPVSAPEISQEPVQTPNPIESKGPEKQPDPVKTEPEKKERSSSVSEALQKAEAKVKEEVAKADKQPAKAAEPKDKAEPVKSEPKEAPKDAAKSAEKPDDAQQQAQAADQATKTETAYKDAPARFDTAAKAEWEKTPEAIRGATHRIIRELEQGHQKYKADSEAYGELKEFADLARQHNTTMKQAMTNYVGIEKLLRQDPVAGLEKVVSNLGLRKQDGTRVTLHDVVSALAGQKPDERASRQDSTIADLNAKIARLEQQVGGVTKDIGKQREAAVIDEITAFAAKPEHARFEELSDAIMEEIKHGYDLATAYERAEKLNPATNSAPAQTRIASIQHNAEAQTLKGSKSIAGAPSDGSEPAKKQASNSIRDALKRAMAQAS